MTETLALRLRDRGHDVVVFCRPGSPLERRLSGEVACEPILRGFDAHPRTVWRCARAIRRHRPQLVVAMTAKDLRLTGPAARLLGVPVLMRESLDAPYKNRPHYRVFYGWVPAHFAANSEATKWTILRSAPWIEPSRVSVVHDGIDVERFAGATPLDLQLPPGAVAIGFVGRFEPRKGLRELAAAWPRVASAVPEAHLVLAGRGHLEAEIRERLAGAPRVHWLGFREDVPALMAALDVLAVPSHWEGFGLVAVEALAAGTPVVAGRASSLTELVTDGVGGRLVPIRDPEALASVLIELARDPQLRSGMAAAGRERVRRDFSIERMLDECERLFPQIAGLHGAHSMERA